MTEIILGPPGTGKTTTLLNIIETELAAGVPPNEIAYISFTRRATEEAVRRACSKFNLTRDKFPYFSTMHSLCFRALGLTKVDVMSDAKVQEFADHARIRISGKWTTDGMFSGMYEGDRALHIDNMSRVKMIPLREQFREDNHDLNWNFVERVSKELRMFKDTHAILDYTDMLEEFIRQQTRLRDELQIVVVDEAQDLSKLQWCVVSQISDGVRRQIVSGDDDQAIYQWAGADVNSLINMEGETTVLGQSWRVPREIQAVAHSVASRIRGRREKEWKSRDADGSVVRVHSIDEVDFSGDDILVLVRNEYVMRPIRDLLRQDGIVYEAYGHSSIKERYLEAAEYWERLRQGASLTVVEIRKVYGLMSVGQEVKRGHKTLPGLSDDDVLTIKDLRERHGLLVGDDAPWYDALSKIPTNEVSYMRAARKRGIKLKQKPAIRLSTIHTAKGAEAKHVVVLKETARRTQLEMEKNPDEEMRVWYVAVTRAKEKLTLVESPNLRGPTWL